MNGGRKIYLFSSTTDMSFKGLNTPPKLKKPSNGEKSATSSPRSAALPAIPDHFIIRPSVAATSLKSTSKVYASMETLRRMGIAQGEKVDIKLIHSGKSICCMAQVGTHISDNTLIELSTTVRRCVGALIGDLCEIIKHKGKVDDLAAVRISMEHSIEEKTVREALADISLLHSGYRFELSGGLCEVNIEDDLSLEGLSISDQNVSKQKDSLGIFSKTTQLEIKHIGSLPPIPHGYGTIGGLSMAVKILKSKLELPLHRPELYKRFNMSPDRGFLLHGPPGTGKTMLLRAVAHESNAHVFTINGPSIVSKYLGETEQALRKIFEDARKYQPSIIFLDEIDAIVPKRDSDDAGEAESRIVSTFLTLMDGMTGDDGIVVIGATNRPNSIDPALRRAGRFGQEIEIGIPDADARKEILTLQLSSIPHKLSDAFISDISSSTHGYVGADLYALCRDAVNRAIQRGVDTQQEPEDIYVLESDISKAFIDVRPSAMKEIILEVPKVRWSDVGGLELVKRKLKETVEWPIQRRESFERLGITAPRGVLLYGPPGCSKTLIVKALATEAKLNFLAVKGPELFNKYVGESERAVREVFRKARAASPSIIFFDEIDALSAARGDGGDSSSGDRVLTSLLNEMDGIESLNGVTVVGATNMPDVIDPALMRPGRLDRLIYVGPPDLLARKKIFEIQFKKMVISSGVDIDYLAATTDGCSGAEIVALCQEAGLCALNEDADIEAIAERHFEQALGGIKRNITKAMIEYYEGFAEQGKLTNK